MTHRKLSPSEMPNWPYRLDARLAAAMLSISENQFLAEVDRGVWPAGRKVGGRIFWHRDQLWRWVDEQFEIGSQSPPAAEGPGLGDLPWAKSA